MTQIKYQLLKIIVSDSKQSIKFSADSDKKYTSIQGIFASTSDMNSNALNGATLELKIADKEIFPEDFEIKMLSCGQGVSPNDRFYNLIDEEAEGSRIEGRFIDGGYASDYPYTVKIYLQLQGKL